MSAAAELVPAPRSARLRRMRMLTPLVASRPARVGVSLLALVLGVAVVGPFTAPGDGSIESMLASRDTPPSWAHPFGTTIQVGVVNEDYVQLARAKDLSPGRILFRYAGRNALLPALTGFAVAFSLAIGGVPAIEEVFSYSGGGWELQQAAMSGNVAVVQALFVAIALSVVVVNVLVDAAQVALDPRLRT